MTVGFELMRDDYFSGEASRSLRGVGDPGAGISRVGEQVDLRQPGTLGFGACGLLLLVVYGRNISEQQPKGSPRADNSVGEAQVAATPIRTRVRKLREDSFAWWWWRWGSLL